MSSDLSTRRGAYGFRLGYPETVDPVHLVNLIELGDWAPLARVTWRYASTIRNVEEIGSERVVYGLRGAATFEVTREPLTVHMDLPAPVAPAAMVHPLLTIGVAILARWRGDVTLHAGAFETPAGAWGVLGSREAGKSSLLASLAERGLPVVADDLLTILDGEAWAGPSCVDLRPDTAGRFPRAENLGIVISRPRYRLSTPPGRPRLPLRGFFQLEWGDGGDVEIVPMPAKDRLGFLYRQEYIRLVGHADPEKLVPLMALPAWRVIRPRDWSLGQHVLDRVLDVANGG